MTRGRNRRSKSVERFEQKQVGFEVLLKSLSPVNRALDIRELSRPGDDERVLAYSSELLKKPQHSDLRDVDLFMRLPKARSEPTYQKRPFERELEKAFSGRLAVSWKAQGRAPVLRMWLWRLPWWNVNRARAIVPECSKRLMGEWFAC